MCFFYGFALSLCLALTLGKAAAENIILNPVERPLSIGSFNIQDFGKTKSNNENVMTVIKKVLCRYDLVLVQEIVNTDDTMMTNLTRDLNKVINADNRYLMVISERLGRSTAKEQYSFIYRSDKLKYLRGQVYPDASSDFMRPPYIAHFSSPTVRGVTSFLAIGIHTQPKNATNETNSLAKVYDYASTYYGIQDAVIMGDMNAGCGSIRISDWVSIALWTRPEFTWLITNDVDTTVSDSCCPYDRFVVAGKNLTDAVIWNSIGTFNFRDAFGLSADNASAVSDHWPIEFELKGAVSDLANQNLRCKLCLTVDDVRPNSLPSDIENQETAVGFNIYSDNGSVVCEKSSSNLNDLIASLSALKEKYPGLLSNESLAAISYKTTSGALNDESSNQKLTGQDFLTFVEFDKQYNTTKITVCTQTSIN